MEKQEQLTFIETLEPKPKLGPKDHFFKPYDDDLTYDTKIQIKSPRPLRIIQEQREPSPPKITKDYKFKTETRKLNSPIQSSLPSSTPRPLIKPYPSEYSKTIREEFLVSRMKGKLF